MWVTQTQMDWNFVSEPIDWRSCELVTGTHARTTARNFLKICQRASYSYQFTEAGHISPEPKIKGKHAPHTRIDNRPVTNFLAPEPSRVRRRNQQYNLHSAFSTQWMPVFLRDKFEAIVFDNAYIDFIFWQEKLATHSVQHSNCSSFLLLPVILDKLLVQENRVMQYWTSRKKHLDQCLQYVMFEWWVNTQLQFAASGKHWLIPEMN